MWYNILLGCCSTTLGVVRGSRKSLLTIVWIGADGQLTIDDWDYSKGHDLDLGGTQRCHLFGQDQVAWSSWPSVRYIRHGEFVNCSCPKYPPTTTGLQARSVQSSSAVARKVPMHQPKWNTVRTDIVCQTGVLRRMLPVNGSESVLL